MQRTACSLKFEVNSVGNANPDNVLVVCTGDGNTDNQDCSSVNSYLGAYENEETPNIVPQIVGPVGFPS